MKPVFEAADFEVVPCPICGGTDFEQLVKNDRYFMGIRTVGCVHCGLVLINPQPKEPALDRFYREHYRNIYQSVAVPDVEYIRAYKKDVRCKATVEFLINAGALTPEARVLDVGASEGALLKEIVSRVPSAQCTAIEPNTPFRLFAQEYAHCRAYETLDEVRDEVFDLVVLNHVLEHVQPLRSFLGEIASRMTPQARLYVDVPSVREYRTVRDFHVGHLYHFGPTSLRRLLAVSGYEVEVLEDHRPVMHPPSLRVLCRVGSPTDGEAFRGDPGTNREGWDACRRAARTVWPYRLRRSVIGRSMGKGKRIVKRVLAP